MQALSSYQRSKPKISINKLAEYMTATYSKKKNIVSNQKNPPAFKAARYTETREAYTQYIISGFDRNVIDDAIKAVSSKSASGEYQINDKETSLQALSCFEHISFPDVSGFRLEAFRGDGKLCISEVDVNVYPDVIFRGTVRGKQIVGAIKIHIIKTAPLNEEGRKTVATVLHQFVDEKVKVDGEIVPCDFVFSIDVFANKCEKAPKSSKRRRADVQIACEEYALWWSKL